MIHREHCGDEQEERGNLRTVEIVNQVIASIQEPCQLRAAETLPQKVTHTRTIAQLVHHYRWYIPGSGQHTTQFITSGIR